MEVISCETKETYFFKDEGKEDEGSEGEEDDEEGDDEPQRSPSPEADVSKSKGNYQYQQDYDKIISVKFFSQKNMKWITKK